MKVCDEKVCVTVYRRANVLRTGHVTHNVYNGHHIVAVWRTASAPASLRPSAVLVKYAIWLDIIPEFHGPKKWDDFSVLSINIFVI